MESFIGEAQGKLIVAVSHGDNLSAACDLVDGKGERFHAVSCPSNCHFVIIDASKWKLIAYDTSNVAGDLIYRPDL